MSTFRTLSACALFALLAACSTSGSSQSSHHGHDHKHDHGHHHDHDHGHHHAPDYTAWQSYTCKDGKKLKVRYDQNMAEVAYNGQQSVLKRDGSLGSSEITVYTDGKWKWAVDVPHGYSNTQAAANGFLTANTEETVSGSKVSADSILAKNCEPAK